MCVPIKTSRSDTGGNPAAALGQSLGQAVKESVGDKGEAVKRIEAEEKARLEAESAAKAPVEITEGTQAVRDIQKEKARESQGRTSTKRNVKRRAIAAARPSDTTILTGDFGNRFEEARTRKRTLLG